MNWTVKATVACLAATCHPLLRAADHSGDEWFKDWEMEDRVAGAQLILVARVSKVSDLTLVHGAKVDRTLREYRFQPVRVLKGIFERDEVIMTHSDLGLPPEDGSAEPPIRQGQLRLLMLARTAEGLGCVSGASGPQVPEAQVPQLAAPDDEAAMMVEAMVRLTESPSRKERSEIAAGALVKVSGPPSVPLLRSLARRAVWAPRVPSVITPLVRFVREKSPAVRAAALHAVSRILEGERTHLEGATVQELAGAIRETLCLDGVETATRVSALRALGRLPAAGEERASIAEVLLGHLGGACTQAERSAAAEALADLGDGGSAATLLKALEDLPLDEDPRHVQSYAGAAVRLAGQEALPALIRRVESKVGAGRPVAPEVLEIAKLRSPEAIPALLRAAERLSLNDKEIDFGGSVWIRTGEPAWAEDGWVQAGEARGEVFALSRAFRRIGDERAVPVLDRWLRNASDADREQALLALDAIGGARAAQAARLRFKAEPNMKLKLLMARMLGRHGIKDGYSLAMEHLADPGMTELAADVVGSLRDGRTGDELWRILETSHDKAWNGAALAGLASVGDPRANGRILEILSTTRDPLLLEAARAAGRLTGGEAPGALKLLAGSRNERVAQAAIESIAKVLTPSRGGNNVAEDTARAAGGAVLSVAGDPDAGERLRIAAVEALEAMDDPRLEAALAALADEAGLESTQLLLRVETKLTERSRPKASREL